MKTQKELKKLYTEEIAEVWEDERMRKYCVNKVAYIIEFKDGTIAEIEKPTIQKNFCFGMGWYGTYNDDEFEATEALASKARTDQDFFIENNLQGIEDHINLLKEAQKGNKEVYKYGHYYEQPADCKLMGYDIVRIGDNPEWNPNRWANIQDAKKIDNEDIQKIIDGLEEVKKQFEKRLHNYLKKYGLTKLNVWTYVRD